MKVTYNWLKDFVDIGLAPKVLADKLTMAGLEVTSLEEKDGDFVFEFEITSNRPDWLSVMGIAREVAAITNKKLKSSPVVRRPSHTKYGIRNTEYGIPFSIKIEDKRDCPLYTAKIIKDVKVGPSPDWLRKRLELVGCRSVNNIVDITNYVLLTWGEPLHAFDLDKLSGLKITVRRAQNNERITAIDATQIILNPEILVIADERGPVAIAGIMGGKDTEVTQSSKNVLLEAAVFNPVIIRRGRQKIGVQSESSYRFERGIDFETVELASAWAAQLIHQLAAGTCVVAKTSPVKLAKREKVKINLDVSNVQKILGIDITSLKVKSILHNLGFPLKAKAKNNFSVGVPSYRQDVKSEIDLIEEVSRIFGYARLPTTLPKISPRLPAAEATDLVPQIKKILVGLGLNEVITYSLVDKDLDPSGIEIANPLSQEQEVLRSRLILSLGRCVSYNLNQKQDYINIFEVAKAFSINSEGLPKEELVLGIALCGMKSWLFEQGQIKDPAGLLHLKGILEVLFSRLGIKDYNFSPENNAVGAIYVFKEKIGTMLRLDKEVLDALDIKNAKVFALEISLERLLKYADLGRKFVALPKYPAVSRDISLIIKENIKIDDVLGAIRTNGRPLLEETKVVDYYRGKQIPSGYRGLTISCLYRSDERTLTESEINPVHALILAMLADKFGAKIR